MYFVIFKPQRIYYNFDICARALKVEDEHGNIYISYSPINHRNGNVNGSIIDRVDVESLMKGSRLEYFSLSDFVLHMIYYTRTKQELHPVIV